MSLPSWSPANLHMILSSFAHTDAPDNLLQIIHTYSDSAPPLIFFFDPLRIPLELWSTFHRSPHLFLPLSRLFHRPWRVLFIFNPPRCLQAYSQCATSDLIIPTSKPVELQHKLLPAFPASLWLVPVLPRSLIYLD